MSNNKSLTTLQDSIDDMRDEILVLDINEDGYFTYIWSVYDADEKDYLALYENNSKPDSHYIKGSKTNGSSSGIKVTKIPADTGVQLRYLSYDKKTKSYNARLRTSGYPYIATSLSPNSQKSYVMDLSLQIHKGKVRVYYSSLEKTDRDWIGLYDKNADINNYDGYEEYRWVDPQKTYIDFNTPIKPGYSVRYYYEEGKRYSRNWVLDGYTVGYPEIKVMNKLEIPRKKIPDNIYLYLKADFPQLNQNYCYQTGKNTSKYNCIAWSLGLTDRWINPPQKKKDFILLYETYGYEQVDYNNSDATIDLYCDNKNIGTHAAVYNLSDQYWESKLGGYIRIEHLRNDLTSTDKKESTYGKIFASFKQKNINKQLLKVKKLDNLFKIKAKSLITQYTQEEYLYLEDLFSKWKNKWWQGDLKYTSNTKNFTKLKEFDELNQYHNIVPFVIFKLCDSDNFPAIHLIENKINFDFLNIYDLQSQVAYIVENYFKE